MYSNVAGSSLWPSVAGLFSSATCAPIKDSSRNMNVPQNSPTPMTRAFSYRLERVWMRFAGIVKEPACNYFIENFANLESISPSQLSF
ncbi:uncharacterized protein TrAtP1_005622 [Trichoderma atroviride]|uniref:uncharacterized protein n=1 Tax=Hypocrea atroviridis TaxID=63577 RepID=UPI003331B0DC|nr:hypothetical protein TrAtP1_005622 [Trichoderma atroviride]